MQNLWFEVGNNCLKAANRILELPGGVTMDRAKSISKLVALAMTIDNFLQKQEQKKESHGITEAELDRLTLSNEVAYLKSHGYVSSPMRILGTYVLELTEKGELFVENSFQLPAARPATNFNFANTNSHNSIVANTASDNEINSTYRFLANRTAIFDTVQIKGRLSNPRRTTFRYRKPRKKPRACPARNFRQIL